MTLSTTKVRGVPVPLANSAPTIVADLTGMRDEIVRRGNRMAEPKTVREALTAAEKWPGLEFFEIDTLRTYRVAADGIAWTETTEPKSNTNFALVGSVPTPTPAEQRRVFTGVVTIASNGTAEVAYPGGAFPNAVMAVTVQHADADSSTGHWNVTLRNPTVQTLGLVRFRVYNGSTPVSGGSIRVIVIAEGY